MNSKQRRRRRRRKVEPMGLPAMVILFLMLLLIPLLCYWYGVERAERTVPEHATGHVVEITSAADVQ